MSTQSSRNTPLSWRRIAGLTLSGLFVVTSTIFLSLIGSCYGWASQTMASWAQALGAVGAVVAAVWIGHRQHRQSVELIESERERVERQQEERRLAFKKRLNQTIDAIFTSYFADADTYYERAAKAVEETYLQDGLLTGCLVKIAARTRHAIDRTRALRDALAADPLLLMLHGDLLWELEHMVDVVRSELENESSRRRQGWEAMRHAFAPRATIPTTQGDMAPPMDLMRLRDVISDVRRAVDSFLEAS